MGKASKGSGKGAGEEGKGSKYVKRVDLHKFLAKWALRSYPDDRGRPLMLAALEDLSPEALQKSLDHDCCELLRRPGMRVNLACAAVDAASLFLPKLAEAVSGALELFSNEKLMVPVRYMNLAREGDRDQRQTKEQGAALLRQVSRLAQRKHEELGRLAEASAAVYLGALAALELGAVAGDLKGWGKAVPEADKQPKKVQEWINKPADEGRLLSALAHHVKEEMAKHSGRRKVFGELSQAVRDASSESERKGTSSAASSSSAKGKKRKGPKRGRSRKLAEKGGRKKRKSRSSSRSPKKSPGKAPVPPAFEELRLSPEEGVEDLVPDENLFGDLTLGEAFAAQEAVDAAMGALDAGLVPQLSELVSILDNFAEAALTQFGLSSVLSDLKGRKASPKSGACKEILERTRAMATAAADACS